MISGNAYPLNSQTLNEMVSSPEAFKGVVGGNTGKNLSMFGLVDNSAFNNYGSGTSREGVTYSERPAIKLASFIDKIANFKQDDIDAVLTTVSDNPEVLNQFVQNGNKDVLDKLAATKGTTPESFAEGLLRGTEPDKHLVCEDSYGNYILKQANSKIDHI